MERRWLFSKVLNPEAFSSPSEESMDEGGEVGRVQSTIWSRPCVSSHAVSDFCNEDGNRLSPPPPPNTIS